MSPCPRDAGIIAEISRDMDSGLRHMHEEPGQKIERVQAVWWIGGTAVWFAAVMDFVLAFRETHPLERQGWVEEVTRKSFEGFGIVWGCSD